LVGASQEQIVQVFENIGWEAAFPLCSLEFFGMIIPNYQFFYNAQSADYCWSILV